MDTENLTPTSITWNQFKQAVEEQLKDNGLDGTVECKWIDSDTSCAPQIMLLEHGTIAIN